MNKIVHFIFSLLLSIIFLYFAFKDTNFKDMEKILVSVDIKYIFIHIIMVLIGHICRVIRWGFLISGFARISFPSLIRISNIGLMLILVLPFRLGEFVRPYLLKKESQEPVSISSGLGSIIIERTIDGLLVILLLFLTIQILPDSYHIPQTLNIAAYGALGVFSISSIVIVGSIVAHDRIFSWVQLMGNKISKNLTKKALNFLEAFLLGLRGIPNLKSFIYFCMLTLIYWFANGVGFYCVSLAFGFDIHILSGVMIVSIIVVMIMLPSAPGHLGTYQYGVMLGLSIFGISKTNATAYGIFVYSINTLVIILNGLPFLFLSNFSFNTLTKMLSTKEKNNNMKE